MDLVVIPSSASCTKEARVGIRAWQLLSTDNMSFKCCGAICHQQVGRQSEGVIVHGCFALRASKVASFMVASVSSELTSLITPLESLSSSFADTQAARRVAKSSVLGWFLVGLGLKLDGGT